ncbi:stalk domain-containing protein [Gorillibacterium timonense]|uniref:stalk domain-containing protein n=1 Tax=Gorillibacterium timonense TaxID=1689269 RepID=UPI00071CFCC2|nr:stalk domain-containing protein [Gorillibacterium timonense]
MFGKPIGRICLTVLLLASLLTGASLASPRQAEAAAGVRYESKTVMYNGKSFSLQYAVIDVKNPYLRVMSVTAKEGIGHDESLASIVNRTGATVAVNGTFFDAYTTKDAERYPNGLLLNEGETVFSGENQSLVIPVGKTPDIRKLSLKVKITLTDAPSKRYTFSPWSVNRYYGASNQEQSVLFTRAFGEKVSFVGVKAVIKGGKIVTVTEGTATIPADGQVLLVGKADMNKRNILPYVKAGNLVDVTHTVLDLESGTTYDTEDYEAAVGVGPKLVTNGKMDVDPARDGFQDPKITTNAGARSFAGIDAKGQLVLGVSSAATMKDLAGALIKLGLTDAMNLDGGASSGLYAEGAMKRTPGREISNAIVVKRYAKPQVQVFLNGKIVNEIYGYMEKDLTMVPLRGIFERLGATMQWDSTGQVLTVQRGESRLVLRLNSRQAIVNGQAVQMDAAPVVTAGRTYVPLRFAVTALGGKVVWDNKLYRASITTPQ